MKPRLLWALVALAVIGGATAFLLTRDRAPIPAGKRNPDIAIQDGKTHDFSSGKAEIRDPEKEKAEIALAMKNMEEAAKDVSFGPPPAPAAPAPAPATKKAETKK